MTEHGPFEKAQWSVDRNVWHMACTKERTFDVLPFMFTAAIIVGKWEDAYDFYEDRWCYHTVEDAVAAMQAWTDYANFPNSEPMGWHRHPGTGRRREGGDPSKETVRH